MEESILYFGLWAISFIFPALIVLGLLIKKLKLNLYEKISLYFVLNIFITFVNYVFLKFIFRIDFNSLININLSSVLFGIPLSYYVGLTFNQKIKVKNIKVNNWLSTIIIILSLSILSISLYYLYYFDFPGFDNIIYTFLAPLDGVGIDAYLHGASFAVPIFLFLLPIVLIPIFENGITILLKSKKKTYQLLPIKFFVNHKVIYSLLILIFVLLYSMSYFHVFSFIESYANNTNFYEEYYIEPQKENITFPKDKKNLIFIMVESLESSTLSSKNGGYFEESITPHLEELALKNINFSNNSLLGGFSVPRSCGWTIASILCQTSGIPLKMTPGNFDSDTLIPSATTMWDILYENDYNIKVIMGTESNFAKTRSFFEAHNVKDIVDYKEIVKRKNLSPNYREWWGIEDRLLLEVAKEEITELSKDKKPFVSLVSTMDTHFPDGYQDKRCPKKFKDKYLNSYYCSSLLIDDFISWAQYQPFYKDTVIVLVGDHLSMQKSTFAHINKDNRFAFNLIINSNKKNFYNEYRQFSSFDMFPTILSSIGADIKGNRLGLGTNLFSKEKTLIERLGYKKFSIEVEKSSNFYDNFD